jgi:dihydroorotase
VQLDHLTVPVDYLCEQSQMSADELTNSLKNCQVLPAFCDLSVDCRAPAHEDVYSFDALHSAMQRGGYACAFVDSLQNPIDDERLAREYAACTTGVNTGTKLVFAASLTKNHLGKEMSELKSLLNAGFRFFTAGYSSSISSDLLRSSLDYAAPLQTRIFFRPLNLSLASNGLVHEGAVSDMLGLKGIPVEAEWIEVYRIIQLARLSGCPVHLSGLTSGESVELVTQAKKSGVDISCDVALMNLIFSDEVLESLHSRYHVFPVIRGEKERHQLLRCVRDMSIQGISGFHKPQLLQDKLTNFEDSLDGALSLETSFAVACSCLREELGDDVFHQNVIPLLSSVPAAVLGVDLSDSYVLWNHTQEWEVDESCFAGAVFNSPWLGEKLQGKAVATYLHGVWHCVV